MKELHPTVKLRLTIVPPVGYNKSNFNQSEEKNMTPKEMAILAAKALDSKKGVDIKVLEVTEITPLADYFVICNGGSSTHINALCDAVEEKLAKEGDEQPLRREGHREGTWVLLDYGCVVIHVFNDEARKFYALERLWSDGNPVDLTDILVPEA